MINQRQSLISSCSRDRLGFMQLVQSNSNATNTTDWRLCVHRCLGKISDLRRFSIRAITLYKLRTEQYRLHGRKRRRRILCIRIDDVFSQTIHCRRIVIYVFSSACLRSSLTLDRRRHSQTNKLGFRVFICTARPHPSNSAIEPDENDNENKERTN